MSRSSTAKAMTPDGWYRTGDLGRNWLRHWETGTSLPAIIQAIENSKESREYLVDELYSGILGRKADDTGLHFWVNALEKGLSENSLEAALLASVEFKT